MRRAPITFVSYIESQSSSLRILDAVAAQRPSGGVDEETALGDCGAKPLHRLWVGHVEAHRAPTEFLGEGV